MSDHTDHSDEDEVDGSLAAPLPASGSAANPSKTTSWSGFKAFGTALSTSASATGGFLTRQKQKIQTIGEDRAAKRKRAADLAAVLRSESPASLRVDGGVVTCRLGTTNRVLGEEGDAAICTVEWSVTTGEAWIVVGREFFYTLRVDDDGCGLRCVLRSSVTHGVVVGSSSGGTASNERILVLGGKDSPRRISLERDFPNVHADAVQMRKRNWTPVRIVGEVGSYAGALYVENEDEIVVKRSKTVMTQPADALTDDEDDQGLEDAKDDDDDSHPDVLKNDDDEIEVLRWKTSDSYTVESLGSGLVCVQLVSTSENLVLDARGRTTTRALVAHLRLLRSSSAVDGKMRGMETKNRALEQSSSGSTTQSGWRLSSALFSSVSRAGATRGASSTLKWTDGMYDSVRVYLAFKQGSKESGSTLIDSSSNNTSTTQPQHGFRFFSSAPPAFASTVDDYVVDESSTFTIELPLDRVQDAFTLKRASATLLVVQDPKRVASYGVRKNDALLRVNGAAVDSTVSPTSWTSLMDTNAECVALEFAPIDAFASQAQKTSAVSSGVSPNAFDAHVLRTERDALQHELNEMHAVIMASQVDRANLEASLEAAEAENEAKRKEIASFRVGLSSMEEESAAVGHTMQTKELAFRQMEEEIRTLNASKRGVQEMLDGVRSERADLQDRTDGLILKIQGLSAHRKQLEEELQDERAGAEELRAKLEDERNSSETKDAALAVAAEENARLVMEMSTLNAAMDAFALERKTNENELNRKIHEAEAEAQNARAETRALREESAAFRDSAENVASASAERDQALEALRAAQIENDDVNASLNAANRRTDSLKAEVAKLATLEGVVKEKNALEIAVQLEKASRLEAEDELGAFRKALHETLDLAKSEDASGISTFWRRRTKLADNLYRSSVRRSGSHTALSTSTKSNSGRTTPTKQRRYDTTTSAGPPMKK